MTPSLFFQSPFIACVALAFGGAVLVFLRPRPRETAPFSWPSCVCRALAVALVVGALAQPRVVTRARSTNAVVLLDHSASMSAAARARADAFAAGFVAAAANRGQRASIAPPLTAGSDFEAWLDAHGAPGDHAHLIVVSDGRDTRGGWQALVNARVDALVVDAPIEPDVALVSLTTIGRPVAHAPLMLEATLVATAPTRVKVRLSRDGSLVREAPPRDLVVDTRGTQARWTINVADERAALYQATLTAADNNARTDNDRASSWVVPPAAARVVVAEETPNEARALVRALEAAGLDVEVGPARQVLTPAALAPNAAPGTGLAVLANVARADVSPSAIAAMDAFVRAGGGLVVTGGSVAFGAGGWTTSALAPLLPLHLDVPTRATTPTLALAIVIDRSGSMAGPKLELTKEAARAATASLDDDDRIAILAFDSRVYTVAALQPAANRARIFADIARLRAGGGTNIFPALREAIDELGPLDARRKHIILLSDGQSHREGLEDLADEAFTHNITISTIGVGEGADQILLALIAEHGGGRTYHTTDPASIPRLFSSETATVERRANDQGLLTVVPGARADALTGVRWQSAPPLLGANPTRARREAETLLWTSRGTPLLARQQVGLGQVFAWTSDLGARWAPAWPGWSDFATFWTALAREAMHDPGTHDHHLRVERDQSRVTVTFEARDEDDQPLVGKRGEIRFLCQTTAGVTSTVLALREDAPGVYVTSTQLANAGACRLASDLRNSDGAVVARAEGVVNLPWPPEFAPATDAERQRGRDALSALAARTGGAMLPEDPAAAVAAAFANTDNDRGDEEPGRAAATRDMPLARTPQSTNTTRALETPFLVAALFFFVLDAVLRRASVRRLAGRGAAW